jgi:hypothetical protein
MREPAPIRNQMSGRAEFSARQQSTRRRGLGPNLFSPVGAQHFHLGFEPTHPRGDAFISFRDPVDRCISAASRSARPLPRGCTGHVAVPNRSIQLTAPCRSVMRSRLRLKFFTPLIRSRPLTHPRPSGFVIYVAASPQNFSVWQQPWREVFWPIRCAALSSRPLTWPCAGRRLCIFSWSQ